MGEERKRKPENRSRGARRDGADLFDAARGVFMISVAAELAGMHPQTLRVYESRGLIKPSRSPKQTRLYSQEDVGRLRRIQQLTSDLGLNLAGVERVLQLEDTMEQMRRQLDQLQREADTMREQMLEQIDAVHRQYKRELVRWEPPGQVLAPKDAKPFRIPVSRGRRASGRGDRIGSDGS